MMTIGPIPDAVAATFEIRSWDERPIDQERDEHKVTIATVKKVYHGGISGTSLTEWVMAYTPGGAATFVGLERISGAIGGHVGSIVVRQQGTFVDGTARADLSVVEHSGTGELLDARGSGGFVAADPTGSLHLNIAYS